MSGSISSKVENLIRPTIDELNYELVDIQYAKEGKEWYLRIFIDRPEGINLDDCELISKEVGNVLDEKEPIKTSYILEVSSPGIERPLKKEEDFKRFKGELIVVSTFAAIDGQKFFKGKLKNFDNGILTLDINGRVIDLAFDKISSANLTLDF